MLNLGRAIWLVILLSAVAITLEACGGVKLTRDALIQHLPPGQDQACRVAVRDALAQRNVTEDWIRRVSYQEIRSGRRVTGFEAWVFPKDGGGALVVELSMQCRVTRIWARGTR